jgi:hypothetical protein
MKKLNLVVLEIGGGGVKGGLSTSYDQPRAQASYQGSTHYPITKNGHGTWTETLTFAYGVELRNIRKTRMRN